MADNTLDHFFSGVVTQDTKKRIETAEELIVYLQNSSTSLYCEEMHKFVEGLAVWINSSSFKVSLMGLEIIQLLIGRMKNNFKTYVTSVLNAVIDRLGDNKDQVREKARIVLLSLMSPGSTPQFVAERMTSGFTHKVWKVKEETLICLQCALNEWGSKSFAISKLVPMIVKLLDDPSGPVRDQAMMTLVEFYRHVGEKLRNDLNRKEHQINPSRLNMILAKMDDAKNKGLMMANEDELDVTNVQSVAARKSKSVISGRYQSAIPQVNNRNNDKAVGALDEEEFIRCFEDVPNIFISSAKDVTDRINKVKDLLSDASKDWDKRQDAVKELRAILIHGRSYQQTFLDGLKSCQMSLRTSVIDLRSQIAREACITTAFLSQELGSKFEGTAEILIPALVQLLQNSAKIISSSGFVALKFIVQNTPSYKVVTPITCNLDSKSSIIRRQCCELLEQMLRVWPVAILEKQLPAIQEAVKRGLNDADPEAKVHSRRAYWNFEEHFKAQASAIFSGLDASQQKHLVSAQSSANGCSGSSSSSSTSSINVHSSMGAPTRSMPLKSKLRSPSADRARQYTCVSKLPNTNPKQSQLPSRTQSGSEVIPRSNSTANLASSSSRIARPTSGNNNNCDNFHSLRHAHSSSDLSTPAKKPPVSKPLRRNASMRAPRSNVSRTSNAEARYKKSPSNPSPMSGDANRTLKHGSTSQPSSRSVSPSSRYSYINDLPQTTQGGPQRYGRMSMREPSPSRSEVSDTKRRKSAAPMRVPLNTSTAANWSVASELDASTKNLMRRSANLGKPSRLDGNGWEEPTSETSSLSSDNSGKSINFEDTSQAIGSLLSGSWTDRRDALALLHASFQNRKQLSRPELKRVTECFNRLFYDQNPKILAAFLDTLVDFISLHRNDLVPWVGDCLPRLLDKLGSEQMPGTRSKIQKVLDHIRVFFPAKMQFQVLTKFIVDEMKNTTPGVKLAVLGYLHELTETMDSCDLEGSSDVKLAITRIITSSTEPKSPEVRKASTMVFIRIYQLNPELFRSMMETLPKSFQDSGSRILQENSCLLNHDDDKASIPSPSPSPIIFDGRQRSPSTRVPLRLNSSDSENINPMFNILPSSSSSPLRRSLSSSSPMVQLGNKPPNSVNSFNSPKVSESMFKRGDYHFGDADGDETLINGSHDCSIGKSLLAVDKDIFSEAFSFHHDFTMHEHVDDDDDDDDFVDCPKPDEIDTIIQELAYRDESRVDERKNKLVHLILISRSKDSTPVWDHHSKTILMLLLDILKNDLEVVKEMALKVIVELVYNHMERFVNHEELILSSVIEARKDASQIVASTAQDSALVIASLLSIDISVSIILPFIVGSDPLTRLLAFRIQLSIVETVTDPQQMRELLPVIMPGILKGYEDSISAIRKDSVFTLVRIYLVVADELKPYLKDMSNSKLKLLNLYIKKALVHNKNTSAGLVSAS